MGAAKAVRRGTAKPNLSPNGQRGKLTRQPKPWRRLTAVFNILLGFWGLSLQDSMDSCSAFHHSKPFYFPNLQENPDFGNIFFFELLGIGIAFLANDSDWILVYS